MESIRSLQGRLLRLWLLVLHGVWLILLIGVAQSFLKPSILPILLRKSLLLLRLVLRLTLLSSSLTTLTTLILLILLLLWHRYLPPSKYATQNLTLKENREFYVYLPVNNTIGAKFSIEAALL